MHSLVIAQWNSTRRDHPGNPGGVSGSGPVNKCQPFFQVLKKAFQWNTKCEEVFSALKTYLNSPPILVSLIEGELLTLYLVVSDFSTSAVLVRDKDRVQHPVYYCSRALRGGEESTQGWIN